MRNKVIEFVKKNPTVALTILTGYSYFCAFNYEEGFCSYFKIPSTYIDISVIDIIKFASVLISGLFLLFYYLHDFFIGKDRFFNNPKVIRGLGEILFVAGIIGFYGLNFNFHLPATFWYYYIGATLFLCLCYIIRFLIKTKKSGEPPIGEETTSHKNNISNINPRKEIIYDFVVAAIVIPTICFLIGFGHGSKVTRFEVLRSNNFIIIKKYGDNIICKDYNTSKKKLGDSIFVFKLGSDKLFLTISKEIPLDNLK